MRRTAVIQPFSGRGNRLFVALIFMFLSKSSFSAETAHVFVPAGNGVQPLAVQMEYLEDADGTYTIDQVANGQAGAFRPLIKKNHGFTYKKRAMWIRFTTDMRGYNDKYWFLMQGYEHVGILTIFYPDSNSGFHSTEFKEDVAPEQRLFNIHNYLFEIPTPENQPTTYYVRYVPNGHVLIIDLLWSSTKGIIEYISDNQLALGLFFGGLSVMWIYNFLLFLYLRERTYFYYLYYLGAFIATFFSIFGLAPLVFQVNLFYERVFAACAYASVHGMILFARHFLNLKQSVRWLDTYFIFFQWVLVAGAILTFFLPRGVPYVGINYLILVAIPSLLIGGGIRCYQGYRPAYLYCAGWAVFGAGLVLLVLKSLGILSSNFLTNYAIQIASVWEAIIFALALATRLRLIEKESADRSREHVQELQAAVEMEKNAVKQKTMFISAVNHELRSPLQSLTGSIEVLSVMAKSSPMEKFVDKISRASQQITVQMRDIGEYSRLEAGLLSARESTFQLRHLLNGVVDDFSSTAVDKGVSLVLKSANGASQLIGDHDRIRQILNNLVVNAIRFTESGTVTIEEHIETVPASDCSGKSLRLVISVTDTGIGISEDDLPKIFDAFTQVAVPQKIVGTGLGLAIVKRVAALLNATVSVDSRIGKGTRFVVGIPVQQNVK